VAANTIEAAMIRVYTSSVIDAPAEAVWARVRDFNAMPQWHPLIRDSRIENRMASDQVGCVRCFHVQDGGLIREQLLESPLGVSNYVATLKLTPVTDGNRCFAEWSAEFDCAPGREPELTQTIGQGVFQAGLDALKRTPSR
jgi:hypothetical protein